MVRACGAKISRYIFVWINVLWLSLFASLVAAQEEPQSSAPKEQPLIELGDEYHNSIKLLQNRFRIDYNVEEITMVFFREFGSAPVVLVRPDGSKLFQSEADGENVFWYDSTTYDLINIKNPTPGPWQAVGQILPDSRVMVISDIELHSEPLPEVLFSGEILKQSARLTNGGEPINDPEIRDVVSLDIRFISTNNPNYNNFGAEIQTIATFEDNGRGMDERPLDGVFTGQFNLSVANGEWTPVFTVSTPMLSREQVDKPLMLYPNPIKIEMIEDGGGDGYHKLVVDAEREFVDMNTLLIDGKVRFPNSDVQNFSMTEQTPNAREYLIVNYEAGVYRIKLTAYGNTKSGRDFILDVPEFTYLVEDETPVAAVDSDTQEPVDGDLQQADDPMTNNFDELSITEPDPQEQEMDSTLFWGLIIGVNGTILIAGMVMLWLFLKPKKVKAAVVIKDGPAKEGLVGKLKGLFSKKKPTEEKSYVSNDGIDTGILDLSLPKKN